MKKNIGRLPPKEANYLIEINNNKHIAYYNKETKKFLWDMNSPVGCSIANAKTTTWWM